MKFSLTKFKFNENSGVQIVNDSIKTSQCLQVDVAKNVGL